MEGATAASALDSNASERTHTSQTTKSQKKKRVSFKLSLETSDDINTVKKDPKSCTEAPVSIIKKECLTRAIRIARGGEPILMPSRLSGLTQKFRYNNANNIDKLNSLTFKSQLKTKESALFNGNEADVRSSEDDSDANGHGDSDQEEDGDDDDDDGGMKGDDIINSQAVETAKISNEHNKKSDKERKVNFGSDNESNDSENNGKRAENSGEVDNKKSGKPGDEVSNDDDDDSNECDSNNEQIDNEKNSHSSNQSKKKTSHNNDDDDDADDAGQDNDDGDGNKIKSNKKPASGKSFVLPSQSTHSSRVIKPNKRFMDESQITTKKTNNAFNSDKMNKSKNCKPESNVEDDHTNNKSTMHSNNSFPGKQTQLKVRISFTLSLLWFSQNCDAMHNKYVVVVVVYFRKNGLR